MRIGVWDRQDAHSYWMLSSTWSLINKVSPQDGDQSQSEIRFKLWQKETLPGASITPTNGTVYLLACTAGVTNESTHRWAEIVESVGWGELLQMQQSKITATFFHTQKWKCWSRGQRASTLCKSDFYLYFVLFFSIILLLDTSISLSPAVIRDTLHKRM